MKNTSGGALSLNSLNHISLICRSVEKSLEFYQDVLGLFPIRRPESLKFEGAWLRLGVVGGGHAEPATTKAELGAANTSRKELQVGLPLADSQVWRATGKFLPESFHSATISSPRTYPAAHAPESTRPCVHVHEAMRPQPLARTTPSARATPQPCSPVV
ncbi:hypothetical protein Taro_055274 [Colocasia esculenta]|uniref:Glyoxalase/fosfomycin resistance/dioxygenase domain-containing protein n=1 Tax=Colocasia esculenta TaxID=4460 RepID=A0A843XQW0_COLES|nr:hypothetical protein [Colocasia esculenta]